MKLKLIPLSKATVYDVIDIATGRDATKLDALDSMYVKFGLDNFKDIANLIDHITVTRLELRKHLHDQLEADWLLVASVVEVSLKKYHAKNPQIREFFLVSDGAGCYSCNDLCLFLGSTGKLTGMRCLGHFVSEAGCGKSPLDAHFCLPDEGKPMKELKKLLDNAKERASNKEKKRIELQKKAANKSAKRGGAKNAVVDEIIVNQEVVDGDDDDEGDEVELDDI
jgi:hypothetical protein